MSNSLYCGKCKENFPPDKDAYGQCPSCGGYTAWSNVSASLTAPGTSLVTAPNRDDLTEYRRERYLAMGFCHDDAVTLSLSREQEMDGSGRPWTRALYPGRVESALKAGCTHRQAMDIFAEILA